MLQRRTIRGSLAGRRGRITNSALPTYGSLDSYERQPRQSRTRGDLASKKGKRGRGDKDDPNPRSNRASAMPAAALAPFCPSPSPMSARPKTATMKNPVQMALEASQAEEQLLRSWIGEHIPAHDVERVVSALVVDGWTQARAPSLAPVLDCAARALVRLMDMIYRGCNTAVTKTAGTR